MCAKGSQLDQLFTRSLVRCAVGRVGVNFNGSHLELHYIGMVLGLRLALAADLSGTCDNVNWAGHSIGRSSHRWDLCSGILSFGRAAGRLVLGLGMQLGSCLQLPCSLNSRKSASTPLKAKEKQSWLIHIHREHQCLTARFLARIRSCQAASTSP